MRPIAFGLACCLSLVAAVHFVNLTMDDAFISFRYAENLAAGNGLVFNIGERVEGYTNFLWTVLLAVPAWFGAGEHDLGMLLVGKFMSLGFSLGSLAVVCWDRGPAAARRPLAAFPLGAVFLATTAPALVWSMGALEGPMVGFLLALSAREWFREVDPQLPQRKLSLSALWLALACMTRPEPIVLIAPLFALRLAFWSKPLRGAWREHLRYLLTFAVPCALFLLWRWSYYGDLLPNTYYAKLHGDRNALDKGLRYLGDNLDAMNFTAIAAIGGVTALLARGERRRVALLFSVCAVQLAGVAYEGGDWMPGARLLVPTLPLFALLINSAWRGALGFELQQLHLPTLPQWVMTPELREKYNDWLSRLGRRFDRVLAPLLPALLTLALCGAIALGARNTLRDWAGREGSGFQAVHMDRGIHFTVARWLNANVHDGGTLATGEIGVVPYYTKLPVLDLFGLTDAHIAHLPGGRHSKFDLEYFLQRAPQYVYLLMYPATSGQPRRPQQNHGRVLLQSPEFQKHYAMLQDFGEGIVYQRRP